MTAKDEADRLADLQREERGWHWGKDLNGKKAKLPNSYEATPENEWRAREIIRLRKQAAR